jgi:hypothetical protein
MIMNHLNKLTGLTLFLILFVGCKGTEFVNSSIVKKDQAVFRMENVGTSNTQDIQKLVVYKQDSDIFVKKLSIEKHSIKITPIMGNKLKKTSNVQSEEIENVTRYRYSYHYPEVKLKTTISELAHASDTVFLATLSDGKIGGRGTPEVVIGVGATFKYKETSPIFKAISIPLKFRFAKDSVDYSVSSGVSVGLSYGLKKTNFRYKPIYYDKSLTSHKLSQISTSFVGFFGFTPITLKPSNTSDLSQERTVLGLNLGGAFVVGFNKFSLGLAGGIDHGIGGDAKNWRYQNEPWLGVIIGLDFY